MQATVAITGLLLVTFAVALYALSRGYRAPDLFAARPVAIAADD